MEGTWKEIFVADFIVVYRSLLVVTEEEYWNLLEDSSRWASIFESETSRIWRIVNHSTATVGKLSSWYSVLKHLLQSLRDVVLPPRCKWDIRSSGMLHSADQSSWTTWSLMNGPTGPPETSLTNYTNLRCVASYFSPSLNSWLILQYFRIDFLYSEQKGLSEVTNGIRLEVTTCL